MTLLLLLAGLAAAQDDSGPWWLGCVEYDPIEGLPSATTRLEAQRTNTQLFGVVETAQTDLFPLIDGGEPEDSRTAFILSMRSVHRAVRQPALARGSCDAMLAPVDLFASSFGFGFRKGMFGAFYATNITGTLQTGNPVARVGGTYLLGTAGIVYAPVAPFVGAGEAMGMRWDWVAGVQVRPGTVTARFGYIGTKGLYTNLDERTTALFLRSAVRGFDLQRLPYLASGIDRLPLPKDLQERIGSTRLFGRSMDWYTAPAPPPDAPEREDVFDVKLWTGHIEQYDIHEGRLDVRVAWTLRPEVLLHEAVVAYHSPYFRRLDVEELQGGDLLYRVQAGVVQMPGSWAYGIAPGIRPMFAVEVGGQANEYSAFTTIAVRYNHADTLDIFPYAVGGVSIHVQTGFAKF